MIEIAIEWEGPFGLDELKSPGKLDNPQQDAGLYQIYGEHPVYGRGLIYIGQTSGSTFSKRIAAHGWGSGSEPDPKKIEVYVGRWLKGQDLTFAEWKEQVDIAEWLLVHAHGVAYNSALIKDPPSEERAGHVRVLNFGACRSLAREVSGTMWTKAANAFRGRSFLDIPPK